MVLPQQETRATCLGLLQSAIERHFAVDVTRERRTRDVYRLTNTNPLGRMLWRYPDPEPGTGFSRVVFSVFMGRSTDAPMFPLEGFAVHSVPFMFLVNWFEEILGGQVIDETGLPGIYGFELKERLNTPEALIQVLRDEAGLVITRDSARYRRSSCGNGSGIWKLMKRVNCHRHTGPVPNSLGAHEKTDFPGDSSR